MDCVKIIFSGRVQGVGFRYRTLAISRNHDITGYVKNLSNESVEVVACGQGEDSKNFIEEIRKAMGRYITDVRITNVSPGPSGEFSAFNITY